MPPISQHAAYGILAAPAIGPAVRKLRAFRYRYLGPEGLILRLPPSSEELEEIKKKVK